MLAGLPFDGPVGAVRVGRRDGKFVVNPDYETVDNGDLNMVFAGTLAGISMVEAGAQELSEDEIVEALDMAHKAIVKICNAQLELVKKAGTKPMEFKAPEPPPAKLVEEVKKKYFNQFLEKIRIKAKHERSQALSDIKKAAIAEYAPADLTDAAAVEKA
jgi:polyribonucleotide nucleotidyltransferase